MKFALIGIGLTVVLAAATFPGTAISAGQDVVIGDVDDMSGFLSDNLGMGGVEAILIGSEFTRTSLVMSKRFERSQVASSVGQGGSR